VPLHQDGERRHRYEQHPPRHHVARAGERRQREDGKHREPGGGKAGVRAVQRVAAELALVAASPILGGGLGQRRRRHA
jgi:hypothetical protein